MTAHAFDATLSAQITHQSGPVIATDEHVLAWIVADGMPYDGSYNRFDFGVCAIHADPDHCDCPSVDSTYRATVHAAEIDD